MEFYSREVYTLAQYCFRNLPEELKIQFDCDKFMQSISFMDDNKRQNPPPWLFSPGWRPFNASRKEGQTGNVATELEDQLPYRVSALDKSQDHDKQLGWYIPQNIAKKKQEAMSKKEVDQLIQTCNMSGAISFPKFSYASRVKGGDDPISYLKVPIQDKIIQPEPEDKSEDVLLSNEQFDHLVNKNENSKAEVEFDARQQKKAERKLRKARRNNARDSFLVSDDEMSGEDTVDSAHNVGGSNIGKSKGKSVGKKGSGINSARKTSFERELSSDEYQDSDPSNNVNTFGFTITRAKSKTQIEPDAGFGSESSNADHLNIATREVANNTTTKPLARKASGSFDIEQHAAKKKCRENRAYVSIVSRRTSDSKGNNL